MSVEISLSAKATIKAWVGVCGISDSCVLFCMAYQYGLGPETEIAHFIGCLAHKLAEQRMGYNLDPLFELCEIIANRELLCFKHVESVKNAMVEVRVIEPCTREELCGALPALINLISKPRNTLALEHNKEIEETNLIETLPNPKATIF